MNRRVSIELAYPIKLLKGKPLSQLVYPNVLRKAASQKRIVSPKEEVSDASILEIDTTALLGANKFIQELLLVFL